MSTPAPTHHDLALIGAALLSHATNTIRLGHVTPAETLDYTGAVLDGEDSAAPAIVRDFVAWTSRRQDVAPGAEQRIRDWLEASGWIDRTLDVAATYRGEDTRRQRRGEAS